MQFEYMTDLLPTPPILDWSRSIPIIAGEFRIRSVGDSFLFDD
ncbi:hypothetical protein COLO4_04244 [Corchorus olitorius]|uniref:Uncharacterized protein n=1 Tax=Corchorus olitorius TaxID=93759 RepID=A0A1R3KUQ0_9ROSI|nr:hypothetical protein COLO4_04244 [Corchorus olitorius]